jgi:hypothetical protein
VANIWRQVDPAWTVGSWKATKFEATWTSSPTEIPVLNLSSMSSNTFFLNFMKGRKSARGGYGSHEFLLMAFSHSSTDDSFR